MIITNGKRDVFFCYDVVSFYEIPGRVCAPKKLCVSKNIYASFDYDRCASFWVKCAQHTISGGWVRNI